MDASVRKALRNLQGMLDEGFITKAEYAKRRQVIVNEATSITGGTTSKPPSIFDRLGTAPTGPTDGRRATASTIRKPGQRVVTVAGTSGNSTGDLRAKLGGIGKKRPAGNKKDLRQQLSGQGSKPRGPAKCPW